MSLDGIIQHFLGSEPGAGAEALHELVASGIDGEQALFSRPIQFPRSVQVRRRWLRYVASREPALVARLLNLLRTSDGHAAAYLFAGLRDSEAVSSALYDQLKPGFGDRGVAANCFLAWGHAGCNATTLWDLVEASSYSWEKLKTFAFRGACVAVARVRARDLWAIEQLITHERGGETLSGLTVIGMSPDALIGDAIEPGELGLQATDVFSMWRRGEVADEVLRRWASHSHWRVRLFAAQIMASLRFQRTVTPLADWLRREEVPAVRKVLLHALQCTDTAAAADLLVKAFEPADVEQHRYVAKVGWRAADQSRARAVLRQVADAQGVAGAEALVSLARLADRHPGIEHRLDSHDDYDRVNAALALAYLGDSSSVERLVAMQRAAASSLERVYLKTALAILGQPGAAVDLARAIVAVADAADYEQRMDLFLVHQYLQAAVLDGLAAGGAQTREALALWKAELDPLDPFPEMVVVSSATSPSVDPGPSAAAPSEAIVAGERTSSRQAPLRIFVSYSHKDEKLHKKLGEHLAPLVDGGLIRIWHDRQIEAGADWKSDLNKAIGESDIILLLVSASFLKSRYCREELLRALEHRSTGKSVAIPIILRPCDWQGVFNGPDYALQALPRDDRPVAGGAWQNQDAAFTVVARELRATIEGMLAAPSRP